MKADEAPTGPYSVVHHHDAKGAWYRVIDESNGNVTVRTFRGQDAAHRWARKANYGKRSVERRAGTMTDA